MIINDWVFEKRHTFFTVYYDYAAVGVRVVPVHYLPTYLPTNLKNISYACF